MQIGADKQIHELAESITFIQNQVIDFCLEKSTIPRITKFGAFMHIRELDELPQLYNLWKGEMSFIGNQPIQLYEAKMLLKKNRFHAPGGMTGLWQVTKRGKANMSEMERIHHDNEYVENMNLFNDIKILLKTPFAIIQAVSAEISY